jgi:hypothetical protein
MGVRIQRRRKERCYMTDYADTLLNLGIQLPEILLPAEHVDPPTWPVVACDQFTSEPEYWDDVERTIGERPSTMKLILPECYLEDDRVGDRISRIHQTMEIYKETGVFSKAPEGAQIVLRHLPGKSARTGLMLALDLERYDYGRQSTSPIRPTEGTIVERIPPRKRIRTGAAVEVPHIMVLLDDPGRTVIEPLAQAAEGASAVYSIPLMKNGGSLEAYRIDDPDRLAHMASSFAKLADPETFREKYNSNNPFYIAIGDGNHSLASAKAYWEDLKTALPPSELDRHPARFAMVEAVNLYDDGITFEPIHRLFFDVEPEKFVAHLTGSNGIRFIPLDEGTPDRAESPGTREIGFISTETSGVFQFQTSNASETTAAVQSLIDTFLSSSNCRIDFVHDLPALIKRATEPRNACCVMPKITKEEFFAFIVDNGAYPRKSFSMGESNEKRYYMEARGIRPDGFA